MKKPGNPRKFAVISLREMQDMWPKTEDGQLCARLLQSYGYSLMVNNSLNHKATPDQAQAESGAARAMAAIVKDFGTLGVEAPEAPKPPIKIKPLHRFSRDDGNKPEKPETNNK